MTTWAKCEICRGNIFKHCDWSHEGGTPHQDHDAEPAEEPTIIGPDRSPLAVAKEMQDLWNFVLDVAQSDYRGNRPAHVEHALSLVGKYVPAKDWPVAT